MVTLSLEPITAHPRLSFRPVGAHVHDGGVSFRVWAPKHSFVRVVTGDGTTTRYVTLEKEPGSAAGFFCGRDEHGRPGDLYWYQLDHQLAPDPASRFQPRGVEGPSQVINPHDYAWRAVAWKRPPLRGRVIYELHVGAFTPEGTFTAAISRLGDLADLGVNTIELMPLGDFPGGRNWGYDGVMIHAPARCYGTPDELRALIDAAHAYGLAVMVDVVYNHLGPCGNVMSQFSNHYFHLRQGTVWGAGLNFDGPEAGPVRQFFIQNACMWFDEYRVDGLRLDAVHAIHDESTPHLIAEIAAAAHLRGAFVVAEDERNDARIITPVEEGGWGVDGMWSDDFHHTMRVAVTGERAAHFVNYSGALNEWLETLREGWFYRGQFFPSWNRERGVPAAHLAPEKFILCISNHDQIGNRPLGDRLNDRVPPEVYRAVSVLGCLVPYTPLLFMGQEWAAGTSFPYFCDLPGNVGAMIAENRLNEFKHHGATHPPEMLARMPDPQAEATFRSAKLNWAERSSPAHANVLGLYRECLHLRAAHAVFQSAPRSQWSVDKIDGAIALRWIDRRVEWLLIASVENGCALQSPDTHGWELMLASNEERFGGTEAKKLMGPGAALWRMRKIEEASAPGDATKKE
jgi:maltooligosyltrehalose trehalohydrolase